MQLEQILNQVNSIKNLLGEKVKKANLVQIETHNFQTATSLTNSQASNLLSQSPITTRLILPVQDTSWSTQFAERITMLVGQQQHAARIRINPPELGPIEVKINMQNEQANIHVIAQHQVVREALEDSMPRLKELLQQQGISLDDFNVSSDDQYNEYADDPTNDWHESFIQETTDNSLNTTKQVEEDLLINAYV